MNESELSSNWIRATIRKMHGYTPGEQPRDGQFIKLNTNENPYPPSPRVIDALQDAIRSKSLAKYPDPLGRSFCAAAAKVLDVDPAGIVIGNGSDDILTIMTRAFVPEGGRITTPTPGYLLYGTLADVHGARLEWVPLGKDWSIPKPWPGQGGFLTYLANPNSPSGTWTPPDRLRDILETVDCPVVLDEAYVDFAPASALSLLGNDRIMITRTLSKSYALAGMRFGFGIMSPEIARELIKVKDSYNCDTLSLVAAEAAIQDQDYMLAQRRKILSTRERSKLELEKLGFAIAPSHANFLWCTRADQPVRPLYERLKAQGILVRYMSYQGFGDGLRISIGTDEDMLTLSQVLSSLL